MNFNNDEKQIIANKIKCISETDMKNDHEKLKKMATEANTVEFNERCRVGNNVVDFFTFREIENYISTISTQSIRATVIKSLSPRPETVAIII